MLADTPTPPPARPRTGRALSVALAAIAFACSGQESNSDSGEPETGGSSATSGGATATGGSGASGGGAAATAGLGGEAGSGAGRANGGSAGNGAGGTNGGSAGVGTAGAPSGGTTNGGAGSGGAGASGGAQASGAAGGGEIVLDPTPGNYRQTCDGSLGVAIDAEHFLDGNDENQGLRLYRRGADANPLQTLDVSSGLGLSSSDEADLEDAARIDRRIYVVSSHGRDKDGNLERERYRIFGVDLAGTSPNVTLTPAGSTSLLLDQMLSAANWVTPNTQVIATLAAASELGTDEDEELAPKANGTSIEALAAFPTTARPKQLLVGFRNPTQGARAIVVSLLNADAALTGATASFGEATLLELGGLGLRAMAWSPVHAAVLVLAGPKAEGGPFRLYKWSGPPNTTPAPVLDVTNAPADSSAEALVVYPNTRDVQVLFDQGEHLVGGTICKDVSASSRAFTDAILRVP